MKTRRFDSLGHLCLLGACSSWLAGVQAQPSLQLGAELLANNEIRLTLTAPAGLSYRIDAATELPAWSALATLPATTATSLQYTDSIAPSRSARYYRAVQLTEASAFAGDHLSTAEGDVIIHPLYHASFVLNWNGKIIYNDPDDDSAYEATYQGLPKADLILVSHSHGDHFSATKIEQVRGPNAVIVAPQAVYNSLSAAQKALAIVLTNNASTNLLGLTIDAVPAYNANHPRGSGNGYVLTIGGKRSLHEWRYRKHRRNARPGKHRCRLSLHEPALHHDRQRRHQLRPRLPPKSYLSLPLPGPRWLNRQCDHIQATPRHGSGHRNPPTEMVLRY